MANEIGGNVIWNLDVDKGKLSSGLASARSEVNKFANDAENRFSSMAQSVNSSLKKAEEGSRIFAGSLLAVGTAAAGALGYGVKIAGDLEAARQGFVALLGSAEQADATMNRIKKEAAATPFELTGLVAGAQALTAITKDGNKAIDTLLDVGKAIATSGKGQAELDRVILNLQQIASTGTITAMDIRQFQGAIPMFNDIIEAAGLTTEELQNADNAAELLFGAFEKAGQAGGITAQGFAAQAGTFNQLWSNLIDTLTIGASEFVKVSGVFDFVKDALAGVIDTLGQLTTPENIKSFVEFVTSNFPIIAGIIIGGVTPALYGMAKALIATLGPLVPFIAAGALIGAAVKLIVDSLGGWQAVQEKLTGALTAFGDAFNKYVRPALDELWKMVTDELVPALKDLWEIVGPVLGPVLKVFAGILGGVVIAGLRIVIEVLKVLIGWITDTVNNFVSLVNFFKGLPASISNALSGVKNAITQPFTDAWNSVKNIASNIKGELDKINPFHRNSPSLVDNVRAGVGEIIGEYKSLKGITLPSLSGLAPALDYQPAFASVGNNESDFASRSYGRGDQNITFEEVNMYDEVDIDRVVRELGFEATINPGMN